MLTGSITGAARHLAISQPSTSRLISDLENNLGFALFDRSQGRLQPTPEALLFYREVNEAFIGLNRLELMAEQIRQQRTGHLTVHVAPALSATLVPGALQVFRSKRPTVRVDLEVRAPIKVLEALQSNLADVALTNPIADLPGVEQELLSSVDFICALPHDHPLKDKDIIEAADLDGMEMVGLSPDGPFNWTIMDRLLAEAGATPSVTVTTQRSHTAYSLVAAGQGVAILEPFSAPVWQSLGVHIKPFRPKLTYSYAICFPGNVVKTQLALEFADAARDYLAHNPPVHQGLP